jgi:hypothetical protein
MYNYMINMIVQEFKQAVKANLNRQARAKPQEILWKTINREEKSPFGM